MTDDEFRIRPGKPRTRDADSTRFVSQVIRASAKAGVPRKRTVSRNKGRATQHHRGAGAIRLKAKLHPRARRVTIKTRLVNLRKVAPRNAEKYLRYIERDGVTREGEPTTAYGPSEDQVDTRAFESRGHEDRHQFRFIVSAEDANELGDLKSFTRDLMQQMEKDCGTKLDWVAVDHWDTDNPHTHIVLRGKDQQGGDLIIAREYIAHGMRTRASEIATEWLGLRTEREIRESLTREVDQERWTSIDRQLTQNAEQGSVELEALPLTADARWQRSLKLGRLQRLQQMGLAKKTGINTWVVHPQTESILRTMGERGDIIRTMQRALSSKQRPIAIESTTPSEDIVGRVIGKGLADELQERRYLIVDALDGKAHYILLPASSDLDTFPKEAIVRLSAHNTADHMIVQQSRQGIYRVSPSMPSPAEWETNQPREESRITYVRRLEALRRAGIVERIEEGVWRIPLDMVEQGQTYDVRKRGGVSIQVLSYWPLEQQVTAIGATWLDQRLVSDTMPESQTGFSGEVRNALRQRLTFLADEGYADRMGSRVTITRNLLATLRSRELQATAEKIAKDTHLHYHPLHEGQQVSGTYRRSITLASGRFAMVENGMGFTLVPWRPVIERQLGKQVNGIMRGSAVDWDFSRSREMQL